MVAPVLPRLDRVDFDSFLAFQEQLIDYSTAHPEVPMPPAFHLLTPSVAAYVVATMELQPKVVPGDNEMYHAILEELKPRTTFSCVARLRQLTLDGRSRSDLLTALTAHYAAFSRLAQALGFQKTGMAKIYARSITGELGALLRDELITRDHADDPDVVQKAALEVAAELLSNDAFMRCRKDSKTRRQDECASHATSRDAAGECWNQAHLSTLTSPASSCRPARQDLRTG
ncbi:hypothetical protein PAPYR_11377 [Paratrimastix pyriformis]|uniref:Uncharacterized protein n=1 Tax=Paratrimastix pyriformis TaxID=342808 RepID=A0ABQ8U3V5_9EUKA|nr:hypothetical protein PAPYR_11377 [Paratrimastix pyriformis]